MRKVTPISCRRLSQSCARSIWAVAEPSRAMFTRRPLIARLFILASNTGPPTVSMMMSTPLLSVACKTASTWSSFEASIPTSMPNWLILSSLAAEREDAITGRAPISEAIWIAAIATPPEAPLTSTDSPATRRPLVTSASCAVIKTLGNAAASIHDRPSGTGISANGSATTYSAWQPRPWPITRSPLRQPLTPSPTSAISPANSTPVVMVLPERSSFAWLISPRLRPAARTLTSTCPAAATGTGISCTSTLPPSGPGTTRTAFTVVSFPVSQRVACL
ncbi:hypothetical protein D9M72_355260 [compost metagenome]